jgi:hypothetical protein
MKPDRLPASIPEPVPEPVPEPITVGWLAQELLVRNRLDPISARRLPARVTTLLRRTVRAMPRRVAGPLSEVAPPPRSGNPSRYASALLGLLDAYDALAPGGVLPGVARLGDALDHLIAAAAGDSNGNALGDTLHAVVSDAYQWRASRCSGDRLDERDALLDAYLALVGEGFVNPDRWATLAASELGHVARYDNPAAAAWYAERSLAWAPAVLDDRSIDALVISIETLVSVGHHLSAIAHSPRFVARLDWRRGMSARNAVTLRCALARAHSDLGEHVLAIEHAADSLARARRAWGARARGTQACDALFDECFQRAVASR